MARWFPLVRTVIEQVQGAANLLVRARPATTVRNVVTVTLEQLGAATSARSGPTSVTMLAGPAARTDHTANGTLGQTVGSAANATHQTSSDFAADPALDGVILGRQRTDLARTSGATAAAADTFAGRSDWQNPGNATGPADGSDATFAGAALGARSGQLSFTAWDDWTGKDHLTLTQVLWRIHIDVAGTLLNNADVRVYYTVAGQSEVLAQTITGNVTGPLDFDLSSAVTVASDLDGFTARITAQAAMGETWTVAVDAAELVVAAHHEVTP